MRPYDTGLQVDVEHLKNYLVANPEIFDKYNMRRTAPGSPHSQMVDIWVRHKDIQPHLESGDSSTFGEEHESIWYPEFAGLPQVRQICAGLMYMTGGTRLGGVLITKLPPGGRIEMHSDSNWHADYYEKYFVPIQNAEGAAFHFNQLELNEDGYTRLSIDPFPGEVWWFDNSEQHGVINNSTEDRLAMIVCIRRT